MRIAREVAIRILQCDGYEATFLRVAVALAAVRRAHSALIIARALGRSMLLQVDEHARPSTAPRDQRRVDDGIARRAFESPWQAIPFQSPALLRAIAIASPRVAMPHAPQQLSGTTMQSELTSHAERSVLASPSGALPPVPALASGRPPPLPPVTAASESSASSLQPASKHSTTHPAQQMLDRFIMLPSRIPYSRRRPTCDSDRYLFTRVNLTRCFTRVILRVMEKTYAAFAGDRLIAGGELEGVLSKVKKRLEKDDIEQLLIFEEQSGRQVDFDFRGTLEEVLERELPQPVPQGPGRPKLGVVSREISLLPAHWTWLEEQPNGISAALRRLVDEASKRDPDKQRARKAREAAGRFMTALAGDRPNFEEAMRALYAGNREELTELTSRWPRDIRAQITRMLG